MGDLVLARRELQVILDAAVHSSTQSFPTPALAILEAVGGLVQADLVFWNWLTPTPTPVAHALVESPAWPWHPSYEEWHQHLPEHPVMCGRHGPVVAISDVLTPLAFRRTWLYHDVFRVDGLRHEIGVHLPCPAGDRNVVTFARGPGSDFGAYDRSVLTLLRPHLASALIATVRPPPQLTPRQIQVLRLVRDGLTDGQIARRLGIVESTVGKHLEHIFHRTHACSRAEAVARCADLLDL